MELVLNPQLLDMVMQSSILHHLGIDRLVIKNGILMTKHNCYDDKGALIGEHLLDMFSESQGTINILILLCHVFTMFKNGGTLIIDDLFSHFHPLVTKFIIDLFQSPDNNNSQLIFTTREISILNNQQLRRDEIAFVDKDSIGHSKFYTLADIKIRSDASYAKDYLLGKYGAIPTIIEAKSNTTID